MFVEISHLKSVLSLRNYRISSADRSDGHIAVNSLSSVEFSSFSTSQISWILPKHGLMLTKEKFWRKFMMAE